MKAVLCFVFLFAGTAFAGNPCTSNSECQAWECCQVLSEYIVVSKRNLFTTFSPKKERRGTCEPYKQEGNICNPFDSRNGYCSCSPGTNCQRARIPTTGTPFPTTTTAPITDMVTSDESFETTTTPTTTPYTYRRTTSPPYIWRTTTNNWRFSRSARITPTWRYRTTTGFPYNKWRHSSDGSTSYWRRMTTTVPFFNNWRDSSTTRRSGWRQMSTTTSQYRERVGRTIPPPPPGFAEEFTCVRQDYP